MAIDYDALEAYCLATPAALALVEAGNNAGLVEMLNGPDGAATVAQALPRSEVLAAIGDGMRTLTDANARKLLILLGSDNIDFANTAIRNEVREIFTGNTAVLDRLTAAASRPKKIADRFGARQVTLRDVREIAERIPTSAINVYYGA